MKQFILCFLLLHALILNAQTYSTESRYDQVRQLVSEKYMDSINIDSIINDMVTAYLNDTGTIRLLLRKLDPYSYYYDTKDYADFKSTMSGTFGGVGLAFAIVNQQVYVAEVFPNTPAFEAGILAGDRIVSINDLNCAKPGLSIWDVIYALRGEISTKVQVDLVTPQGRERNLNIMREQIYIKSVSASFMVNRATGYIKLDSFTDSSAAEVHSALEQLMIKGMKHCILDLRNNPGGYMREARKIADEFLPEGALEVYTIGRQGREDYYATSGGLFELGDVTILVNEYTASSSEILTGALQGNKRAAVIGNRTFGKGLVQRIYTIGDSTEAIKLTTERYYTPLGICIQQPYKENEYVYERQNEAIEDVSTNNKYHIEGTVSNWGITPDLYIAADTSRMSSLTGKLDYKEYIANAVLLYYLDRLIELRDFNDPDSFLHDFEVDDQFIQFLEQQVINWESGIPIEEKLEVGQGSFVMESETINHVAKAHLAKILFGSDGYYRIDTINDAAIEAAIKFNEK